MTPIFLSAIFITKNPTNQFINTLSEISQLLSSLVTDFEIIVIDNGSDDASIANLKKITTETKIPNVIVFTLTNEIEINLASWVGLENAIGDYVVVLDADTDDFLIIPEMLEKIQSGADVVFAKNISELRPNFLYNIIETTFNYFYKIITNIEINKNSAQFRLLNRQVVNFILQHPNPSVSYKYLPVTGGFQRFYISYQSEIKNQKNKKLALSVEQGIQLLISTSKAPMRIVTSLSIFGAIANLVYSLYVVFIAIFKPKIAEGWVSQSLQQSGMFFLFSLVLLVLGEYILAMTNQQNKGPHYHISQEFSSPVMTHRQKLNLEIVAETSPHSKNNLD